MIEQRAHAVWRGGLKEGSGSFRAGALAGEYSFASRFEGGTGASPEALIGAAHAGCFSMALALFLGEQGYTPDAVETTATVHLDPQRLAITRIELETEAEVPGLSESAFPELAEQARKNCPVSKALAGVEIVLQSAKLKPVVVERA
jgi:osmotically inducible protein OsmC